MDRGFRYAVRIGNVPLIGGGERVARGVARLRVLAYPKVAYLASYGFYTYVDTWTYTFTYIYTSMNGYKNLGRGSRMISYIIYLYSMLYIDTHRDTYPGEDPGGRLAASRKGGRGRGMALFTRLIHLG